MLRGSIDIDIDGVLWVDTSVQQKYRVRGRIHSGKGAHEGGERGEGKGTINTIYAWIYL